jgi:hypothetical protein
MCLVRKTCVELVTLLLQEVLSYEVRGQDPAVDRVTSDRSTGHLAVQRLRAPRPLFFYRVSPHGALAYCAQPDNHRGLERAALPLAACRRTRTEPDEATTSLFAGPPPSAHYAAPSSSNPTWSAASPPQVQYTSTRRPAAPLEIETNDPRSRRRSVRAAAKRSQPARASQPPSY